MFNGKSILVTGGTGSFGKCFCETVLRDYRPERLIVYSRDEYKQARMTEELSTGAHPAIRYFLGDVRDRDRLLRAMSGVDFVIHAAALKQVPAAEYNPLEFIKTNIHGTTNVVEAAIDAGVHRVIALSTDKAVNPVNLYGATKLCSDKIFIAGNSYAGRKATRFSVVRYGNVLGSRGSVIPRFLSQRASGKLTVTDLSMTRFFISIEDAVGFTLAAFERMQGGELFVPKLPSCSLGDVVEALAPDCEHEVIGTRPGEKLHETLIPADEAHLALEFADHFVVQPTLPFWDRAGLRGGSPCKDGFSYASDRNPQRLGLPELHRECQKVAVKLGLPPLPTVSHATVATPAAG